MTFDTAEYSTPPNAQSKLPLMFNNTTITATAEDSHFHYLNIHNLISNTSVFNKRSRNDSRRLTTNRRHFEIEMFVGFLNPRQHLNLSGSNFKAQLHLFLITILKLFVCNSPPFRL